MIRAYLFIIFIALLFTHATAQTMFSPVDYKLTARKNGESTDLVCSGLGMSVRFQLKQKLTVLPQNSLLTIDGHTIQITPLKFSGYKGNVSDQNADGQKQLLGMYSKYELDYFKNDLHVEITNSSNQWITIKGRGWFIWYFRVDNTPAKVAKQMKIQLFASTIIGDHIFTINAPVFSDGDFDKAGLIVNDMMESLTVAKS